jgi:hypothetical protein
MLHSIKHAQTKPIAIVIQLHFFMLISSLSITRHAHLTQVMFFELTSEESRNLNQKSLVQNLKGLVNFSSVCMGEHKYHDDDFGMKC